MPRGCQSICFFSVTHTNVCIDFGHFRKKRWNQCPYALKFLLGVFQAPKQLKIGDFQGCLEDTSQMAQFWTVGIISVTSRHPKMWFCTEFCGGHTVWALWAPEKFQQSVPLTCLPFTLQHHLFYRCTCALTRGHQCCVSLTTCPLWAYVTASRQIDCYPSNY